MLLIKNGFIHTMDGPEIDHGFVVVDGEVILRVGRMAEYDKAAEPEAQVIDAGGGWVLPGLIDAHSHIGICEDGIGKCGDDVNELTDPVTPQMSAVDAVNPADPAFADAVRAGVTAVMTGPGSSNVVGGQFVFMKTRGSCVDEMIVKAPAAMKVAFGENPKCNFADQNRSPGTRMAIAAMLREELMKAMEYRDEKHRCGREGTPFKVDLRYESWLPVLAGEIPLKAHVHRADDIFTAIRIAREFGLEMTLDHCTESYLIAEHLQDIPYPLLVGPALVGKNKPELRELKITAAVVLERHGIAFSLITDHPVIPVYMLPLYAGISVREGLSPEAALRAITVNPAKACGVERRVGRIRKGLDADIAIFDGNPLETMTKTLYTIINGEIVYAREREL